MPWHLMLQWLTLPDVHAYQQYRCNRDRCWQWSTLRHERLRLHHCPNLVVLWSGGWRPAHWQDLADQRRILCRDRAVPAEDGWREDRDRLGHGFGWHAIRNHNWYRSVA